MANTSSELSRLLEMLRRALNREREEECSAPLRTDHQALYEEFRPRIVAWLTVLNDEFHFDNTTLFLAVDIFDRFLRLVRTQPKYLMCIGVTCLYLAAKNNEEDEVIPVTSVLVEHSGCGCSVAEILRMELCILTKLSWNIRPVSTAIEFLHLYHGLLLAKCSTLLTSTQEVNLDTLVKLLQFCLPRTDLLTYSQSTVALSVFSVYLELTWQYWLPATLTLQAILQLSKEEMSQCHALVHKYLRPELSRAIRTQSSHPAAEIVRVQPAQLPVPQTVFPAVINRSGSLVKTCRSEIKSEVLPLPPSPMDADESPPLTPNIPAKRRRIEQDDDVYDDIRSLYDLTGGTGGDGLVLAT